MSAMPWIHRLLFCVLAVATAAPAIAQDGVLRVYIARHGITDWNVALRVQGSTDNPLNETGRKQAAALVERMRGVQLDHIYTAGLQRARQTAEGFTNVKQTPIAGLNERNHGKFEGIVDDPKNNAEMSAEYRKRIRIVDDSLDGGESLGDQHKRVGAATRDILSRHKKGGSILIVGHGADHGGTARPRAGCRAEPHPPGQRRGLHGRAASRPAADDLEEHHHGDAGRAVSAGVLPE